MMAAVLLSLWLLPLSYSSPIPAWKFSSELTLLTFKHLHQLQSIPVCKSQNNIDIFRLYKFLSGSKAVLCFVCLIFKQTNWRLGKPEWSLFASSVFVVVWLVECYSVFHMHVCACSHHIHTHTHLSWVMLNENKNELSGPKKGTTFLYSSVSIFILWSCDNI